MVSWLGGLGILLRIREDKPLTRVMETLEIRWEMVCPFVLASVQSESPAGLPS